MSTFKISGRIYWFLARNAGKIGKSGADYADFADFSGLLTKILGISCVVEWGLLTMCSIFATMIENDIKEKRKGVLKISPKEQATQLSARINSRSKKILENASKKAGMSMTEYLERLIEGTLPGKIEAKIEALTQEISALREALEEKK